MIRLHKRGKFKKLPTKPVDSINIRTIEEIEHEEYIHEEALKLGINLDMANDEGKTEDFDKLEALIYLMQGKKVPEEFRIKRIQRNLMERKLKVFKRNRR